MPAGARGTLQSWVGTLLCVLRPSSNSPGRVGFGDCSEAPQWLWEVAGLLGAKDGRQVYRWVYICPRGCMWTVGP